MYDDGDYEASVHIDFIRASTKPTRSLEAQMADVIKASTAAGKALGGAADGVARDAGPKSSTAPTPRAACAWTGRMQSASASTQQRRDQPAQKSGRSDVSDEQRGWDDLHLALAISASESETKGSNGGATPVSSELDITAEALWELCAPDVANAEEGASGAPSAAPTATTALAATEEEAKQTEKEEEVDEADEVALMGDMGPELSESGEEIPLRRQRIFPMVQSLEAGSSHDVHETVTQGSCSTAVKETVLSGVPRATPTVPACSVCGRDDFQHNGAVKTHEHHCQKRANRKARLEERVGRGH